MTQVPSWDGEHLIDCPELVLELLAKCVAKLGGSISLFQVDEPSGSFNLAHRMEESGISLRLLSDTQGGVT